MVMKMKTIKVIFADPSYNFTTKINGTREEILLYYVGNIFNCGTIKDDMQRCTGVEFLD